MKNVILALCLMGVASGATAANYSIGDFFKLVDNGINPNKNGVTCGFFGKDSKQCKDNKQEQWHK